MRNIAAALTAILLTLAACGNNNDSPLPPLHIPSQEELDAQATSQAEHNRIVSSTAQAMTQATVTASELSPKGAGALRAITAPSTSPTCIPDPTPAPASPDATLLAPYQYASQLYDCLQSNSRAKAMFIQPPPPPGDANSQAHQEYQALNALNLKNRKSFVESHTTLIAENPATGPLLSLAWFLCQSAPAQR